LSEVWMLSEAQMRRIEPYFPLSHGIPRVDDRRIVSGIIFVLRTGLRWRDAPAAYCPHKTIYNRYDRCAHTFMSAICIAATVIFWLPQWVLSLGLTLMFATKSTISEQ
jgi:transposase